MNSPTAKRLQAQCLPDGAILRVMFLAQFTTYLSVSTHHKIIAYSYSTVKGNGLSFKSLAVQGSS